MMLDTLLETSSRYDDDYPFNPPDIPDRPWEPEDETDPDDDEDSL